jgi:seryl-tRNA synthetase
MSSPPSKIFSVSTGVAIPSELEDDFLARLRYVSESAEAFELSRDEAGHARVNFRLRAGREQEHALVAERVSEVAAKTSQAARFYEPKVLVRRERAGRFRADPHPLLEERGELFEFGRGRYGLGPRLAALLEFFDRRLLEDALRAGASPHQFPSLVGADLLERCGYLRSFPHSLSFVSHLREDHAHIQEFARDVRCEDGGLKLDPEALSRVECLLSPTVCFHCYAWLEGRRLARPAAYTARGKCFRYESGNMSRLERLWDFTMRELIFVGPETYVRAERDKSVERLTALLDEWGLSYEIKSATDPFFIDGLSASLFQLAFDLKYEVRAALPYKGKTLAVGSFNLHRDHFGRALDITCADGEPVSTGCVGFGLERLALAFLAQHGLDAEGWPASVAAEVGGF